MAENRESVILDVKLDAGKVAEDLSDMITRIAALKEQQKTLNAEIKAGNDIDGKYSEQLIRVKDQLAWTEKQAKGLSATTKLLNADTMTYSDSLNGERQKLADMQKAYDQLDGSMRESDGGKAFLAAIKAQSDAVKGLEESTGRAQRNVGNYPKIMSGAFGKAEGVLNKLGLSLNDFSGGVTKAFSTLGTSLKTFGKALLTPPIALVTIVLSAIVVAVQKVVEAFKKNDDAMTALQKAFAIFEPFGQAVSAIFDGIALAVGKAAEKVSQFVTWIADKLSPAYAEAAKSAQDLIQAQDDLEEQERQYTVASAERSKEVSRLRAEAADNDKYTAAERRDMLRQAIDLEKQNLEDEKAIAAERLRILEETAKKQSDTSDETKNKIAEARAEMMQAEKSYYDGVRELQSQLTAFDKEAQQAAAKRAADEKRAAEERKKNAEDIARQAQDFALSLIKDETEKAIATRKVQGDREIAALQKRLETEKNLTEESRQQLAQLIKDKQAALDAELENMATKAAKKLTKKQVQAEQERAQRILEYKLELAADGSAKELELQKQLLDMQMQKELEAVNLSEEEKFLIRKTFADKAKELDKQYHDSLVKQSKDARKSYADNLKKTAKSASDAFGAMSDLLEQYGEDNEKAAAASKAFGIAKIIVDQATSIADTAKALTAAVAGATEAAASTGPAAPFTLAAYIASMVGAVLGAVASVASSIAQAKQIIGGADAGNFATGGVVGGSSYTGDKMIAHVNSGEGIYTPGQANNILQEVANNPARGGFDYGQLADVLASAVAAQPAPVLVLQEFREFEQKVSTFNEIAKI